MKENYFFKDTRSPTRKWANRPAKRSCDITDSDDDDVVITGVVRLDNRQSDSFTSLKYADSRRRRKIEDGPAASQRAAEQSRYSQDAVRSQGSIFFSKRKQFLEKEPENFQETRIDREPSEPRQCYSQDMFESQRSESPGEEDRLVSINQINTHRKTVSNDTSSQIEIQSVCIDASQESNGVRSRKPDNVFDWKSVLNLCADDDKKAKGECVENGSGTDSGSDDDLVLRDLSEFLLLSEFRRNSKKDLSVQVAYGSQPLSDIGNLIDFDSIDSSVNLINTIDPNFNAILNDHDKKNNCSLESVCYSPWQSAFDNYPKYPLNSRSKNRGEAYWKGYLQNDRDPTLLEADRYEFKSKLADRDRCIREFLEEAGMILESESAERGVAPSYEYQFYRKRIYSKNRKDSGSRVKTQHDMENDW